MGYDINLIEEKHVRAVVREEMEAFYNKLNDRFVTVSEAAYKLGVDVSTVNKKIKAGHFKTVLKEKGIPTRLKLSEVLNQ